MDDDFLLYAIMPTLRVREPLVCGPIVFCTTEHLGNFRISPRAHEDSLRSLLARFHDAFGTPLDCLGLQLIPQKSAEALPWDQLPRAARDAVALCYLTGGTARNCHLEKRCCIFEADYFDALPISLGISDFVVARPGLLAYNNTQEDFHPTLRMDLFEPGDNELALDKTLLDAFTTAVAFLQRHEHERDLRQVFRAVAIAVDACRILHLADATYYDLGPRIVSWISAFETLVHPETRSVGLTHVLELIGRIRWFDSRIEAPNLRTISCFLHPFKKNGETLYNENSARNYYRRLYNLRNDLAHGNRLDQEKFAASATFRNGCRIDEVAALLFRECLLQRFRDIGVVEQVSTGDLTCEEFQLCVHEQLDGAVFHDAFAKALLGPAENDE